MSRMIESINAPLLTLLLVLIISTCLIVPRPIHADSPALPLVEFRHDPNAGWMLYRDGQPYFIRGAGGYNHFEELAAAGGNSVRVWDASARTGALLEKLHHLGLTAMVGITERQFDQLETIVSTHKDAPALLLWAIGNEMELRLITLGYNTEQNLWTRVNELAKRIHALDDRHPVVTVLAEVNAEKIKRIKQYAPELDAIGVNSYGGVRTVAKRLRDWGWEKPFIITEFGPIGHWESPRTPWGLYVEPTSTEKAAHYLQGYTEGILGQRDCVGSYVFLWGNKQEKTHTWYGLFLPKEVGGGPTEAVDVMTKVWTGHDPVDHAPRIGPKRILIVGKTGGKLWAMLKTGETVWAAVDAADPEGGALKVRWDLRIDVADNPTSGGFFEPTPPPITGVIRETRGLTAKLQLPQKPGNYRLFCYVWDEQRHAATANLPIRLR
jgi:hypothetical protein